MKTQLKTAAVILGVGLGATMFSPAASAGCADLPLATKPAVTLPGMQSMAGPGGFIRTAFFEDASPKTETAAIVGLWKVTLLAQGNPSGPPDGTLIDFGYAAWHGDGTELTNSGSRSPASSSFCMGAWKQTGRSSFKLNHWALSWTPDGTAYVGPANIRQQVTVDRGGNSFSGTFTIDQYDASESNVLGHVAGVISGARITAD